MSKLIDAGKEVLGTCREAYENSKYDDLVKEYDQHTADRLILKQLEKDKITLEEFHTYKKVKSFVQKGGLSVNQAVIKGEEKAAAAIDGAIFA